MTAEQKLKYLWEQLNIPIGVQYVSYRVRQYRDEPSNGCFLIEGARVSDMASIWLANQVVRDSVDRIIWQLKDAGLIESYWDGRWSDWDDAIVGSEFEWSRFSLSNEAVDLLADL